MAFVVAALGVAAEAAAQSGSIRGVVYDRDFEAPVALATVRIIDAETPREVQADEDGRYAFTDVPAGVYSLVFSKSGYARQVKSNVVVTSGELTDVDVYLTGDFTDMEEFVVQDIRLGGGAEAGLLALRLDSPALLDAISSDLLRRAGASNAADALTLVSGATVLDGKFAVIRGLPDRYVSSQINGIRLPSADEDTRAVELDQFPSAVIQNIQIAKTFTPDQQGDASGGAVNVRLRGIPEETFFKFSAQAGYNPQVGDRADFLTYEGGGLSLFGDAGSERDIPGFIDDPDDPDAMVRDFMGAVGVTRGQSPNDYKWSAATGGVHAFDTGLKIGGLASFYYERDSSFHDNGIDDKLWVTTPGEGLIPQFGEEERTQLFDITEASQEVQWGALLTGGLEWEGHALDVVYLYTRAAQDTATLAEDTRGKSYYVSEVLGLDSYDPNDPEDPANSPSNRDSFPYLRTETLLYEERTTETIQFAGTHELPLPVDEFDFPGVIELQPLELDWYYAKSTSISNQPDRRQFGSLWRPSSLNPGVPPFIPPFVEPAEFFALKPDENIFLGNLQRIYKRIEEESDQYAFNLRLPFDQWSDSEGYVKVGYFNDAVVRRFDQDTFSNFNEVPEPSFQGDFDEFWSQVFPFEDHPITDGLPVDIDYRGEQDIEALYAMVDLPLNPSLNVIGGARFESTRITTINSPEFNEDGENFSRFIQELEDGTLQETFLGETPGAADVDFAQEDILPAIGVVYRPTAQITLRASYSETVARQTFKELTPILQQEFLGGPIFVGNPNLQMSAVENYDLRLDYTPYDGGLFSISWFNKKIENPIELVQRRTSFQFTRPENFPRGELEGVEIDARQEMGAIVPWLSGLTLGANATLIDSEVQLQQLDIEQLESVGAPQTTRQLTNAPEFLYNLYLTYDIEATGTQLGLFYTVRGDALVAGAAAGTQAEGNFIPDVYAREFDTLNFSISQKIGDYITLSFKAKNLTNPKIETVYRSDYIGDDVVNTSFTKGIDYSLGLSVQSTF